MSLELWLEGGEINAGFDKISTLPLPNGSLVTFGASGDPLTYTIVDFVGETLSGSVSLGDGPAIEIFHGAVPTESGGFRIVFGSGFPSSGALYQVELDSNFALVGTVEQIADSYSGLADIELLPDGGLAILFNQRDEFGVADIGLQIIAADGTLGAREIANSNAEANILHPRIAINDEAIFTVWFDRDTGASRARIFDLDGNAQGSAFDISTGRAGEERNFITYVEALSNGNFIAVFVNRDVNFETGNSFARLFSSSGTPLGDDIAIVAPSDVAQFPTGVTPLDDGGFILTWGENLQDGSRQSFIAQYDNDAQSVTTPLQLPGFNGSVASISVLPDGRFVVSDTGLDPSFVIVDPRMGNFDGDAGDNLLVGSGTAASTVNGFGGDDQFFGTGQDDTFFGGEGNDILNGGAGNDTLDGGAGEDTLSGGDDDDVFIFDLRDSAANSPTLDTLIDGGDGFDTIRIIDFFGGIERPTYFDIAGDLNAVSIEAFDLSGDVGVSGTADQIAAIGQLQSDFVQISGPDDFTVANPFDVRIVELTDTGSRVDFSAGDNASVYEIYGGTGDDTIIAPNRLFVDPTQNFQFDFVRIFPWLGTNTVIAGNAPILVSSQEATDTITGSDFADQFSFLFGSTVTLNAGDGADLIEMTQGSDHVVDAGAGGDRITSFQPENYTLEGGSGVDRLVHSSEAENFTITQISTGVFEIVGPFSSGVVSGVEFAEFSDQTIRLLPGSGVSVNFETTDPSAYQDALTALRDFDGNDLGGDGAWLRIGGTDVNGDGDFDQILVNREIGRFATVGTAEDGLVYFDDYSWAGETRVAGIYLDPLVQSGAVEQGSPFDSQQRFQNDLRIENINRVLGSGDFDGDGLQEVYFALTDGTAYLRAIMEFDGNIRYANYQSEQEVRDYLTSNGFGEETFGDWFGGTSQSGGGQIAATPEVSAMMWQPLDMGISAEFFG